MAASSLYQQSGDWDFLALFIQKSGTGLITT
jgi:hypothetical protein